MLHIFIAVIVFFNQSMYSVNEGDLSAQPVLVLNNPSLSDITVQILHTDGSATGECQAIY